MLNNNHIVIIGYDYALLPTVIKLKQGILLMIFS